MSTTVARTTANATTKRPSESTKAIACRCERAAPSGETAPLIRIPLLQHVQRTASSTARRISFVASRSGRLRGGRTGRWGAIRGHAARSVQRPGRATSHVPVSVSGSRVGLPSVSTRTLRYRTVAESLLDLFLGVKRGPRAVRAGAGSGSDRVHWHRKAPAIVLRSARAVPDRVGAVQRPVGHGVGDFDRRCLLVASSGDVPTGHSSPAPRARPSSGTDREHSRAARSARRHSAGATMDTEPSAEPCARS